MITVNSIESLRAQIRQWRADGCRIGFVATMGNLHDGHLSLLETARRNADKVVASIFVNPLQFGPEEDFAAYPRTPQADHAALQSASCDLLFAPDAAEMYPDENLATRVVVGALGNVLCGAHRKGHFDGMATVVTKLLNIVTPDVAVFGQKDFQQLVVIRRIVRDLNLPVEIISAPTIREFDGLAMSSRNQYLDSAERKTAPRLHAILEDIAKQIDHPGKDYSRLCQAGLQQLRDAGFQPDYLVVRDAPTLQTPNSATQSVVILVAAALGRARLIDNIHLRAQDFENRAVSQSASC